MPFTAALDASVVNPLIAIVLCAALLWVGSAVAWEATAPGALRTGSLELVAVVLLAAGLWWPAHAGSSLQTPGNGGTPSGPGRQPVKRSKASLQPRQRPSASHHATGTGSSAYAAVSSGGGDGASARSCGGRCMRCGGGPVGEGDARAGAPERPARKV